MATLGFARTSCCGVSANGVADQPSASRNYGPWNATPLLTLLPRHYHARTVRHHELGTHAERLVRLSPDSDQIAGPIVHSQNCEPARVIENSPAPSHTVGVHDHHSVRFRCRALVPVRSRASLELELIATTSVSAWRRLRGSFGVKCVRFLV